MEHISSLCLSIAHPTEQDTANWKSLPGYSRYRFSPTGQVWDIDRQRIKKAPQWGYYKVVKMWSDDQTSDTLTLHIQVAKLYVPNPDAETLIEVNHKDGDKMNCCANNLEWVTKQGNVQHAYDTGLRRRTRGESSHYAKLTNDQAREIYNSDRKAAELAAQYGVTFYAIYKIWQKTTFKNIHTDEQRDAA